MFPMLDWTRLDWTRVIHKAWTVESFWERPICVRPTLRLTTATHSSRCLEAFHCSSTVSGWWSIATWANGRHSSF